MLGKLLKHEFRATARYFLPIYLAMLVISVLSAVSYGEMLGIATIIHTLLAVTLLVLTIVVAISRFQKNLLSDEGYLMFTLPVSASQHITAKLITSSVWSIGSFCMIIGSYLLSYWSLIKHEIVNFTLPAELTQFLFPFIVLLVVATVSGFIYYYMCMSIGQLFNRNKFLASAGVFVGIQVVVSILTSFIDINAFSKLNDAIAQWMASNFATAFPSAAVLSAFWIYIGLMAIAAAIMFFISQYLLKKKLNLA